MQHPPENAEPAAKADFASFGLDPRIQQALVALGFDEPTPIQAEAMPPLLAGRDVIGRARTGSGKTAAFGLPLIERVKDGGDAVRALVLTPTRELALQVTEALRSFAKQLPVRIVTIYGGAAYGPQLGALKRGVPIVVGTPGRVLDHMDRGSLDLSSLELLVLDEADEMLRMGFFEDVEKVLAAAPDDRQVALFSATMPDPIRHVAEARLPDPIEIQVEGQALSVDHITQKALLVPERFKLDALQRVLASEPIEAALVFARTRAGCASVADELASRGMPVDALHGDLSQAARERVLLRLRSGGLQVVIATDVAARGIDVDLLSHVVNYDLPTDPEAYVHRIGRTARAGREGVAISLVTPREVGRLRFFQRTLDVKIGRMDVPSDAAIAAAERRRLIAGVEKHLERKVTPGLEALVEVLCADDRDPRLVAAAALGLLAAERELDLDAERKDEPPAWARTAPARKSDRRRPEPGDEVELFLPVGKKRGIRPADLVGAIANEAGIEGSSIGRVTILDHKSFVRITREEAEQVLERCKELELRGQKVPVAMARPRSGPGKPSRRFDPRRGKPKRHAKGKKGRRWNQKKK